MKVRRLFTKKDGVGDNRGSRIQGPERPLSNNMGFKKKARKSVMIMKAMRGLRDRGSVLVKSVSDATKSSISALDPRTREVLKQLKVMSETLDDAEIAIKLMKNHESSAHIQSVGCEKLANIAVRESEGLVKVGVIRILVNAMKKYPNNATVQEFTSQLAWNLAVIDSHKELLANEGVLEMLVLNLKNHKQEIKVLHKAIGAMKVLSLVDASKDRLVEDGAMDQIISIMKRYESEESSDTADFQETCLDAVQNFAFGKTYVPKLYELGAGKLILDVMRKYDEIEDIQSSGCAALWNLAIGVKDDELMELIDLGAATRLLFAMSAYQEHQNVVLHAMGALKNLSRIPNSADRIKEHISKSEMANLKIYQVIMDAYYAHEDDKNILRIGDELLCEFEEDFSDEEPDADVEEADLTIYQSAAQLADPFADLDATGAGDDSDDDL